MDPIHLSRFTPSQGIDINLVRIYLQVSTLYNISAGSDRRTICPYYLRGERPPAFAVNSHWPRQEPPTRAQTRLWTRFLTTSFLRYRLFWAQPLGTLSPPSPSPYQNPFDTFLPPSEYSTLKDFLRALPSFYRRPLSHYEQKATDLAVWRACRSRRRLEIVKIGRAHV